MTTKIEWVKNEDGTQGYTVNPVKGLCPVGCSYCYARAMYHRFKWDPTVRYDPRAWLGVGDLRKPSRIFVGSTMELFHESHSPQYLKWIFEVPHEFPQHTFIFLTKQPQNLIKWSPFPENCWVGVTATDIKSYFYAVDRLWGVIAPVKYISFEPLLDWEWDTREKPVGSQRLLETMQYISWVICGQQTPVSKKTEPKIEWLQEIVEAADKAGVPVFLKDNLKPLLIEKENGMEYTPLWAISRYDNSGSALLRQELPR